MASINFVDDTLIAGTTMNPGLENVLITSVRHAARREPLEITDNSGRTFDDFKFQLLSTTANFTSSGTTPTAGRITGIVVVAPNSTTRMVEVQAGTNGFGEQSLLHFFDTLKAPDGGTLDALDSLLNSVELVSG